LVIPLEEEIQALKEKLRYTDQQLRKYEGDKVNLRFEGTHFKALYQYTEGWIKNKHALNRIGLFPEESKVNFLNECKLFNAK
jgi:ATP/maltotriose-dependent transcriptional regulator MalT